jgi:TonB-linked SusC/RagA family outer membrane protein
LTYEKSFGSHNFKAMVGMEALKNDSYKDEVRAVDFSLPVAESIQLSTNPNKTASDEIGVGRTLSYFGRLNYDYQGKYLITANIRKDASDKFGVNYRWGTFPSINGAWRISEESFVKDRAPWLANAKLRASYGILGNDGIDQFLYQSSYARLNFHNYGGTGKVQGWSSVTFPNENIKWEEVNQVDIGLDLNFLDNKLSFTYDWYNRQTKDMLYRLNLPISSGFGYAWDNNPSVPINLGQVQNIGSEVTLNWRDTKGGFYYSVGLNASFNSNKVVRIGETGAVLYDGGIGLNMPGSVSRTEDGLAMGQFWGYKVTGIFQSEQQVQEYNAKAKAAGSPTGYYQKAETSAGDLIYDDNGIGYVNDNSKMYIGNPWPKMVYGIDINLAYKGFDLGLLFQGAAGLDIYNGVKALTQYIYGDNNTTADVFNNSFFGNNQLTAQPRMGYFDSSHTYVRDPNGNYYYMSSYFVEKGDYLKLKNLSFGYTLPASLAKKALLQNARLYLSAQNVFTLTKYTGIDPEIGGEVRARGIDSIERYIPTRLFSLGLDLTF